MATLPRFTLKHNKQNDRWDLKNQVREVFFPQSECDSRWRARKSCEAWYRPHPQSGRPYSRGTYLSAFR